MEFIKKMKKIVNLRESRLEQLQKKVKQYNQFQEYHSQCPNLLVNFFVNLHKLNLVQSEKVYSGNCLDSVDNIYTNITEVEHELKDIDNIINSDNFCHNLQKYVEIQNEYIQKNDNKNNPLNKNTTDKWEVF